MVTIVITAVGCPDCGSLNILPVANDIRCDCLDCGFWWNEYGFAENEE